MEALLVQIIHVIDAQQAREVAYLFAALKVGHAKDTDGGGRRLRCPCDVLLVLRYFLHLFKTRELILQVFLVYQSV